MLDEINKIKWDQIKIEMWEPSGKQNPMQIPGLFEQLLNADSENKSQFISEIFNEIIIYDDLPYFNDIAPFTIPFLMRIFPTLNDEQKIYFLDELSLGMTVYDEFDHASHGVSEGLQQVYRLMLQVLEPYVDEFMNSENAYIRDCAEQFVAYFPDHEGAIEHLLKPSHNEIYYVSSYLINAMQYGTTTVQIQEFLDLCHKNFALEKVTNHKIQKILELYANYFTKSMIDDFFNKWITTIGEDWLFSLFILLRFVNIGKLDFSKLYTPIIDNLSDANPLCIQVVVGALYCNLDETNYQLFAQFVRQKFPKPKPLYSLLSFFHSLPQKNKVTEIVEKMSAQFLNCGSNNDFIEDYRIALKSEQYPKQPIGSLRTVRKVIIS